MAELEVREALVIKPGDHVIVRIDAAEADRLTQADVDSIRRTLKEREPLLREVTVLAADGLYVIRDEASDG